MLSLGIVGLPNVGKSTLFNALTAAGAAVANYPFCTVEPNVGVVPVPDERLDRLAAVIRPRNVVPATVRFVDIAGLVSGASRGEGLGNRFLANIREVDAIVHVVRCFEDPDVSHVMGSVDPVRDRDIIELELALADLATVEKRLDRVARSARSGDREAQAEEAVLLRARNLLDAGRPLWEGKLSADELRLLRPLNLLTTKDVIYAANVGEAELLGNEGPHLAALREAVARSGEHAEVVPFSAKIEAELAELPLDERQAFLESLGIRSAGLDRLVQASYRLLGLETFFTVGENEVRAWTVRRGATAPEAAGQIHSDFQRGFIRAETARWDDVVSAGGWREARESGLVRAEGRDYVVQDGDVILFRFNV